MSHPKARFFDDARALADYVRLHGSRPASESDPFSLYRIVHPEQPGASALVLSGPNIPANAPVPLRTQEIDARVLNDRLHWPECPEGTPIQDVRRASALAPLVGLQPDPKATAKANHAIFWTASSSFLETLVTDSLTLGNDRIQFATITHEGSNAVLVRIEQPSFYLLQRTLEDHPEADVYYAAAEGIYVSWGQRHPLEDLWLQPDRGEEQEEWLFFHDCSYRAVTPPIWQDAYQLTDLVFQFKTENVWLRDDTPPERFEVSLSMHQTASTVRDAEMWMLDADGRSRLEDMLQILDEEDLRPFQLSAQRHEGIEFVFVRERRTGKASRHLDLGGRAFASYQGLPNLLLPTDVELLPPLRRDLYRKLFDLEPGTLTILVPDGEKDYLTLRISEKSFQAVESLVDYVIAGARVAIEHKIEESVFKFDQYAKAPSRKDLQGSGKTKRPGTDAALSSPEQLPGTKTAGREELTLPDLETEEEPVGIDEASLPALQRRELELERTLISEGQTFDRWRDLSINKQNLEKWDEAVIAGVEALWLTERETPQDDQLRAYLRSLTAEATIEDPDSHVELCASGLRLMLAQPPSRGPELELWVSEFSSFLEQHATGLRCKERWLFWGSILRVNRDSRREAQLRSDIQGRIVESGLPLNETPPTIRTRIFLDRQAGTDERGSSGTQAALANLNAVRQRATSFRANALRITTNAILARAYAQIGDTPTALEFIEHPEEAPQDFLPWVQLFFAQALRHSSPEQSTRRFDHLDRTLAQFPEDFVKVVEEARDLYERFEKIDNPAAFLSQSNRSRLYPIVPASDKNPLFVAMSKLDAAVDGGTEAVALELMTEMMSFQNKSDYDDEVKLPQFVDSLGRGLSKFRWSERGAALVPLFESFCERVPTYLQGGLHFYRSLLHASLADGLALADMIPESEEHAMKACELLGKIEDALDVMDSGATVISTLEQLPFDRRRAGLDLTLEAISNAFDDPQSHFLSGNPKLFGALVRVLEQAVQASISKDRISLNQFKNYQLQDEFLILQRVQSETPSTRS